MSTPSRGLENCTSRLSNSGISARGLTAPDIISMPYISTAKPTSTVPTVFFRSFLDSMSIKMPAKASRGEKFLGLSICTQNRSLWMPERLVIQAVRVVPTLAPKMMWMVWENCMMPEFTRPTSMTVVAEEDCMAMVMTAPSTMLRRGLAVILRSISSRRPPAIFSRLEDMTFMP